MTEKTNKNIYYYIIPILGTVFVLWYIKASTWDVAYSDYIRQILSYLPDVWNPDKFFVADILTRIPINFPVRGFNVSVLGFSVTFDLILGGLGLGLAAFVLAGYGKKKNVSLLWFLAFMLLFFSLNKWEMLTNGTGWVHFFAFACFYYHYVVFDRMEGGEGKKGDSLRLQILPFFITICVAGPYCAVYTGIMLLAYGFGAGRKKVHTGQWDLQYLKYAICMVIPLFLYMWSNSHAVYEHSGAYEGSIVPILAEQPQLFVKFFIKSFAGMVIGQEAFEELVNKGLFPYAVVYLLGLAVIGGYLAALYLNIKYRLYEKTILPLILIGAGIMNHLLILASRWIFLNDSYGMSSRYALQFQVGILGILLTIGLLWGRIKEKWIKWAAVLWCVLLILGNGCTTYREIKIAPNRQEWGRTVAEMAVHYEDFDDDELIYWFQYRDGGKIREALSILEENHLNVYRLRRRYMKVVILAGGFGTRISEESHLKPKPMIEIGEKPILWHIMKYYSEFGFHDFIICLGYKQYVVKEFFADYFLHTSDVTFDLANNKMEVHNNYSEPWKVTLVDTGLKTMTGGRVRRIRPYVGDEPFMLTYGDGVADVDLKALRKFHESHGKIATITTVNIGQLKGVLDIDENNTIVSFREKEETDGSLINGGFMVLNPEIFNYLDGDDTVFEQEPMQRLVAEGQLKSFYHKGFWQCMDTQREMKKLEELWQSGKAPWKIWDN